jgi:cell division protein FtsI (penicillin-binding protein 3)
MAFALIMCLVGFAVIVKAAYTMYVKKDYWEKVAERFVKENVEVPAVRGNILSSNGSLLVSSLPEYRIYMDYCTYGTDSLRREKEFLKKDSLLMLNLDSLCLGLHQLFPDKSVGEFRERILKGRELKKHHWSIYPHRISYIKYKEVKQLPFFRMGTNKSGFHEVEYRDRKKPFGSLAGRTIGSVYTDPSKDSARFGLERSYDSLLCGEPGLVHRQKVLGKYLSIMDKEPVNGLDIVSTIDVNIQDVAEKALREKLAEINAERGVALVMEVATGEIKAIVNLSRLDDGNFYEVQNLAATNLKEPGSTFKTASMMVALEDGYVHRGDSVDVGCGIMKMHGRDMKDHNWRRGGYGRISVDQILMYSSNVGVSYLIDKYYQKDPDKFVRGLNRLGVGIPLHIPLEGAHEPRIRHPNKRNWWKTTLPWMSIGYETQLTPLHTLTFYNAIANGGKMVRPKFVKAAMKDGEIVREYPTEVIKEKICSQHTLDDIQVILEKVVSEGLGAKAGSKLFKVSGKTGTAQVSQGAGGYKTGITHYMVSFAGYYPSDNPQYSSIVVIEKSGLPASGGGQCGPVFSKIAHAIMAKTLHREVEEAKDTLHSIYPMVKSGDLQETDAALSYLGLPYNEASSKSVYGSTSMVQGKYSHVNQSVRKGYVPNVIGMGARDAVFLLEKAGVSVSLSGKGKVKSQSLPANTKVTRGMRVHIELEI